MSGETAGVIIVTVVVAAVAFGMYVTMQTLNEEARAKTICAQQHSVEQCVLLFK